MDYRCRHCHRHRPKAALGIEPASESSHFVEKGAATIDMHTKGLQILLHRHSCAAAKFLRILAQQLYAVFVEPLGAFDDAAQIFCMGQSIEALEVLSSEAGDNWSMIVIAEKSSVYHVHFPFDADSAFS
jgi:hypothetical protein